MKSKLEYINIYKKIKKHTISFANKHPVWLVTLYLTIIGNFSFWTTFQKINSGSIIHMLSFTISFFIFIVLFTAIIFNLIRYKYIFKPLIIFVIIASAFASYFMSQFGIVIDTTMAYNIMETDTNEMVDLLSLGLLIHVIIFGFFPAFFFYKLKIHYLPPLKQLARNTVMISVLFGLIVGNFLLFSSHYTSFFRNHHHVRYLINPVNYLYSFSKYFTQTLFIEDKTPIQIGVDAHIEGNSNNIETSKNNRNSVIVLVVGETARAKNFSLNGYDKNTNPLLSKEDIINYPNFYSCGTSTHVSLPCMFSVFGRSEFDEASAKRYEKLPDVLQRAGIDVSWHDNNSGCKGVCKNIPTENTNLIHMNSLCNDKECFDEAMLVGLKEAIENKTKDMVIILHQKGSHGPAYYLRHPQKSQKFTPECATNELSNCSTNEITNAYDNTIVYTDYFLSKIIALLKDINDKHDTAMIYVSDHGESLGEHNVYLHSLPYMIAPDEQKHVPFITWMSESFSIKNHIDKSCLKQNTKNTYSHDNLFHSVLGLTHVATSVYQPELDLFKPCITNNITKPNLKLVSR